MDWESDELVHFISRRQFDHSEQVGQILRFKRTILALFVTIELHLLGVRIFFFLCCILLFKVSSSIRKSVVSVVLSQRLCVIVSSNSLGEGKVLIDCEFMRVVCIWLLLGKKRVWSCKKFALWSHGHWLAFIEVLSWPCFRVTFRVAAWTSADLRERSGLWVKHVLLCTFDIMFRVWCIYWWRWCSIKISLRWQN